MKKRYTVKEVIRMDKKMDRLDVAAYNVGTLFFPYTLLTAMGGIMTVASLQGSTSLIPLIIGGAFSLLGGAKLFRLFTAQIRSDRLYEKLENIYEIMGPEFKQQVKDELEDERLGITR